MAEKTFKEGIEAYVQAVKDYKEKFGPNSLDYTTPIVDPLATEPEYWFEAAKYLRNRIDDNDPLTQDIGDPSIKVIY